MRRSTVVTTGIIAGLLCAFVSPRTGDCQDTLQLTKGSTEFDILYWDDDPADDDYCPLNKAQDIRDATGSSYDVFTQAPCNFQTPYVTSLPDFDITIYNATNIGGASPSGISIDAPNLVGHTEARSRSTLLHELFHTVQYSYNHSWPTIQRWAREGTARAMEDKTFADHDNDPTATLFLGEVNDYLGAPNQYLFGLDNPYKGALFFTYAMEQLGSTIGEPHFGVDFVRRFWERVEDTANNSTDDAIEELRLTVEELSAGRDRARNLDDFFRDFGIANYTHDLDATALPDASRYLYIDETNAGATAYDPVDRTTVGVASGGSVDVSRYGNLYLEANASPIGACTVMGFHGESDEVVGWALVGVASGDRAVTLQKGKGTSFYAAVLQPSADPLTKLTAVVTGLETSSDADYEFAIGDVKLVIQRPTLAHQALVGPHGSPGRFIARLRVGGIPDLTPEGAASISGLDPEAFDLTVGTRPAEVVTGAYVGGDYWLVVDAPEQDADGSYSLTVILCGQPTTSFFSVLYGDYTVNQVLVLDKSGSMNLPAETPKIDAAKTAACLFIDAARGGDRLGVITFNGNDSECNEDSQTIHMLQTVDGTSRGEARTAVGLVSANGWTSIGDGIHRAESHLGEVATTELDLRYIILLSDGMENEGRFWESANPCPAGPAQDPVRPEVLASGTVIHSIAFGPETNQELMNQISWDTEGDYYYVDVSEGAGAGAADGAGGLSPLDLTLVNRLSEAYASVADRIGKRERLFFFARTVAAGRTLVEEFPLEEKDVADATLYLNWEDVSAGASVALFDPAGALVTERTHPVEVLSACQHTVYRFKKPIGPGKSPWRAEITFARATQAIGGFSGRPLSGVRLDLFLGQIPGSGPSLGNLRFVAGMPVQFAAALTDERGIVRGARVRGEVERPDRTVERLELLDDGGHGDGKENDGIYGAVYARTALGSEGGVPDDESGKEPGQRGSYIVTLVAEGKSFSGEPFTRHASGSFQICTDPEINPDQDRDLMPDRWEVAHGLDPAKLDAKLDSDGDGLSNLEEFLHGTDPLDPDTDGGGESDGSEVKRGANPLDPSDDFPCKLSSFSIVTRVPDGDRFGLRPIPRGIVIAFSIPLDPCKPLLHLFRAEKTPADFREIAALGPGDPDFGTYLDKGLTVGVRYFYYFIVEGPGGETSPPSEIISGVPLDDPVPPEGWVQINCGSPITDSLDVLVSLDTSSEAAEYMLSTGPGFSAAEWSPLEKPRVEFRLEAKGPTPGQRYVYCKYRNASGAESFTYFASILHDPSSDLDGDRILNSQDPDDDGDEVSDRDEIERYCSKPYNPDTDGDRIEDGAEVKEGTNPASSDTDGDGLTDPEDPDPLNPQGGLQRPGDCNQDNRLDISDGVCLLGYLFLGSPTRLPCGGGTTQDPGNVKLLDSNGDQAVNLSDAVYVLSFLFTGGPPPEAGRDCILIPGCPSRCVP